MRISKKSILNWSETPIHTDQLVPKTKLPIRQQLSLSTRKPQPQKPTAKIPKPFSPGPKAKLQVWLNQALPNFNHHSIALHQRLSPIP